MVVLVRILDAIQDDLVYLVREHGDKRSPEGCAI